MLADAESELVRDDVARALAGLTRPAILLRAERGILNQMPPLYPEAAVAPWLDMLPTLRTVGITAVNHYTILLGDRGAKAVSEVVRELQP